MALSVSHNFVSPIADAGDPNIVGPDEWNDVHSISGVLGVANGGTGASSLTSGALTYYDGSTFASSPLFREDANTIAQRNSTTAQSSYVYNTYTDASNYERGIFGWSSNELFIGVQAAGTGVATRNIGFYTNGAIAMYLRGTDNGLVWNSGAGYFGASTLGYLNFEAARTFAFHDWSSDDPVKFAVEAANIWAQRNSTNAQKFNIYNTYTNSSNYERVTIDWTASSFCIFGTEEAGTGSARAFRIGCNNGSTFWEFATNARLFMAGDVVMPDSGYFYWSTGAALQSPADGILAVSNNAANKNLYIAIDASDVLSIRNGTTAQTFRAYNTFTDASNYERGVFDFTTSSNVLTIGTQKGGTGSTRAVTFVTGGTTTLKLTTAQSVVTSAGALATNATDGFLYIPTCAGTPTGTPTAQTGTVALVYDTTNNKLYVYNGAWKGGTNPGAFT